MPMVEPWPWVTRGFCWHIAGVTCPNCESHWTQPYAFTPDVTATNFAPYFYPAPVPRRPRRWPARNHGGG